jgi:transcriptional regulator with XRE-family HTH domain
LPESRHRDANLVALGLAIRQMRELRGMSTDELADAGGISRRSISALERGKIDPTYELLLAVADGLHAQPSTLVALAEQLGG